MTEDVEHGVSPAWAAVALAGVDRSTATVRRQAGWEVRVFAAYGAATVVFFPAAGLLHGPGAVLAGVAWAGFLLGVVCYAVPRRVLRHGFRRLYLTATGVWTALWLSGAVLGQLAFHNRPAYWLPAGLIVAVPMATAAMVAARRRTAGRGTTGRGTTGRGTTGRGTTGRGTTGPGTS